MNHTSAGSSSPKRRQPAEALGPRELTRFGEFVYAIIPLLCTQPVPLPPAVRASTALRALCAEASPDMVRIGVCIRDLYVQEEDLPGVSLEQGTLLWDAIREAITLLESGQWMRAYGQQQGWYGEEETREVPAILLTDIAQRIIDGAFSDGCSRPPQQVRWPRVRFALALDAQCSDAYVISGMLHEEAGLYLLAHCAYETSRRLAAERFGGEDALVAHHILLPSEKQVDRGYCHLEIFY